jgi:hypothetical protein
MLSSKEREMYDKISGLSDPKDNMAMYRKRLAQCKPPCIPYLGTHLSDLTFVYECLKSDKNNPARESHAKERTLQVNLNLI